MQIIKEITNCYKKMQNIRNMLKGSKRMWAFYLGLFLSNEESEVTEDLAQWLRYHIYLTAHCQIICAQVD